MTIMPNTSRSSRIMSKTEDALRKELNCALRNPRFTSSVWMRLRVASPPPEGGMPVGANQRLS